MPVYEVWHATTGLFGPGAADFVCVGKVLVPRHVPLRDGRSWTELEQLDLVYEKTNHIDQSWTQNIGVHPWVPNPRSSSVGDLIRRIYPPDTRVFQVSVEGFTEVPVNLADPALARYPEGAARYPIGPPLSPAACAALETEIQADQAQRTTARAQGDLEAVRDQRQFPGDTDGDS